MASPLLDREGERGQELCVAERESSLPQLRVPPPPSLKGDAADEEAQCRHFRVAVQSPRRRARRKRSHGCLSFPIAPPSPWSSAADETCSTTVATSGSLSPSMEEAPLKLSSPSSSSRGSPLPSCPSWSPSKLLLRHRRCSELGPPKKETEERDAELSSADQTGPDRAEPSRTEAEPNRTKPNQTRLAEPDRAELS